MDKETPGHFANTDEDQPQLVAYSPPEIEELGHVAELTKQIAVSGF